MKITRKDLQKITRRQLRRMIHEATEEMSTAKKLAANFREAGDDLGYVRQMFLIAVTLEHAQEGTLDIIDNFGRPIVSFVASAELKKALNQKFYRFKSAPDKNAPGMYQVAYRAYSTVQ